ncbi:glutamine synthetase [Trebonia kvetii]|uniref:Glutamine synthetase n=2 Tax=Trebonia kvetii TaxID=2480626 RepID=A0A6P2C809_9ACTN|nr:glutamine synthetase [Trebonia kvetii]
MIGRYLSAMTEVLRRTAGENIRLVRFLYVDHGGIVRGKSAAAARLAERIESGIGHTRAMMAMSMVDELSPVEGMGPVGEVRIKPDPDTFVTLPYAPGAAAMLADQVSPDGTPWDGCARTFLKQAIAELAAEGYELQASFEPEFSLGRHEGASFTPIDESLCYSATGFHLAHDYTIDLVDALIKQGLEVEHYYPELGHGQQEVPIRHATALRAADNHVLLRETARAIAIRHGLWASFAAKPLPEQAGNGAHLHASLWASGTNAFADPSGQYGLSSLGYHFLAGVLAHLPGLVALSCGTVNSYRRLAPQMWSGAFACYGPDNREAALRICSPIGSAGSVNLELKPVDSTGNPYLTLGAFIYAGIDGIRRSLDPGEPLLVDPAVLDPSERDRLSVFRLPSSLGAALDALEADSYLMSVLGALRSTAYLAVKRSEAAHFSGKDVEYECRKHWLNF